MRGQSAQEKCSENGMTTGGESDSSSLTCCAEVGDCRFSLSLSWVEGLVLWSSRVEQGGKATTGSNNEVDDRI